MVDVKNKKARELFLWLFIKLYISITLCELRSNFSFLFEVRQIDY